MTHNNSCAIPHTLMKPSDFIPSLSERSAKSSPALCRDIASCAIDLYHLVKSGDDARVHDKMRQAHECMIDALNQMRHSALTESDGGTSSASIATGPVPSLFNPVIKRKQKRKIK